MRKLPPDSEVHALKACGWTVIDIATRYSVNKAMVYNALARWEERNTFAGRNYKTPHADRTFNKVSAQPVEHRDTGENVGAASPEDTYRVRHTSIHEYSDLLREWGVGRDFA